MDSRTRRPSPAMVIAIIALIASLSGTAFAAFNHKKHRNTALPKNSVGTKQIKNKAVTTGKIAPNSVNGSKVANGSLSSDDIRLSSLVNVPSAVNATTAGDADTLGPERHTAGCPDGTALVRGLCYDLTLQGPVQGVGKAASACAAKGGFLPTAMELFTARTLIFLGSGTPPDYAVADVYYYDNFKPKSITVDGSGIIRQIEAESLGSDTKYICAYELVR